MQTLRLWASLLTTCVLVTACGGGDVTDPTGPTPVATIQVSPTVARVEVGQNVQLSATVMDAAGNVLTDRNVSWESTTPQVASVSSSGVVTGLTAGGPVDIRAVSGGKIGSASVTVTPKQIASIVVSPVVDTVRALGWTRQLRAVAFAMDGSEVVASFSWSSSDAQVASVSASGLVTALTNGTTQVTATAAGKSATASITVAQRPAFILLSRHRDTLRAPGATTQLNARVTDENGRTVTGTAPITFRALHPELATVDATGIARAVTRGEARIVAALGSLADTVTIVVDDFEDMYIGWIQRLPEIDFVTNSPNPTRDGWPAVGQQVQWKANIMNWSMFVRRDVSYAWYLDGVRVADGNVTLAPNAYSTVTFPWTWEFARHALELRLDPNSEFPEREERNNQLQVYTDAITLGFYVEEAVVASFREHQWKLGVGSTSFEDWLQRQVRILNDMFQAARYPLTPNGVLDRVRLDKVVIVPDGRLPLAGGLASNHPNLADRTVDLQWGFAKSQLDADPPLDFRPVPENWFFYSGGLLHELGHARYLVDVYGFNVLDGAWTPNGIINTGSNVAIREGGTLVVGSIHMPIVQWEHVFYTPMTGLMGSDRSKMDEYSSAALNRIAGHRATKGNSNAPGNIGVFMNDLPAQNRITIKDASGSTLAGASVRIYQSQPKAGDWYGKFYDDVPDIEMTSDAQGSVLVGRNPFGGTGIVHTYGHSNGVIIIRVQHQSRVGYAFLESLRFNMEHWRGNTALGTYEVRVTLR